MEVKIKTLDDEALRNRLGKCGKCNLNEAKYTCPRCDFKSCSLKCVNVHKVEYDCNGVRDKTKFIRVSEFTDLDLLSDYRMLEETGRSVDNYHRDPSKYCTRINKDLPVQLHRLRIAAAKKGITLRFLPQNFSRHKGNTTYFDWKSRKIDWKIEWRFNWNGVKIIDSRVPEDDMLSSIFQRTVQSNIKEISLSESDIAKVHIFLAAEHTPNQNGRYHEMNLNKTLSDNLNGTVIVEHPIFEVVLDPEDQYPLVGTTAPVRKPQLKRRAPEFSNDNKICDSDEKKSKLTFFDVSDGELSETSD